MTNDELLQRLELAPDPSARRELIEVVGATSAFVEYLLAKAGDFHLDDPGRSFELSVLASTLADEGDDHDFAAKAHRIAGQCLRALGRHLEAIGQFDAAAIHAESAGDAVLAAQVQLGAIDSLAVIGRTDEAIVLSETVERELIALGRPDEAAKAVVNRANIHFRRDEYARSASAYEHALAIIGQTGDQVAIAKIEANFSNVLVQLNRIDDAISFLESARRRFRIAGTLTPLAMLSANEAYLRYVSGEHSAALRLFTESMRDFGAKGRHLELAKCELDIADVYFDLNLLPEALHAFDSAVSFCVDAPMPYERGRAELGRARVLRGMGRFEDALLALETAESLFREQRNRLFVGFTDLVRAEIFAKKGDRPNAVRYANRAYTAIQKQGLPGWAAEARFIAAELDLSKGVNCVRTVSRISGIAAATGRRWLKCRAHLALGRWYTEQERSASALKHFRFAASTLDAMLDGIPTEEHYASFLRDKTLVYEKLVGALIKRGRTRDIVEALACAERHKSRTLLDRIRMGRASSGRRLSAALQERVRSARSALSRAYHSINAFAEHDGSRARTGPSALASLPRVEDEYRMALREADLAVVNDRTGLINRGSASGALSVTAAQSALGDQVALIDYYVAEGQVCAFIIDGSSLSVCRSIATASEIEHLRRRLNYYLARSELLTEYLSADEEILRSPIVEVLRKLNNVLIEPLASKLNVRKLVIIPHGSLHGLPFQAFYDGGQYLCDRFEIEYAPSAGVWVSDIASDQGNHDATSSPRALQPMLVMGVPTGQLSHVSEEVDAISEVMPESARYCGESATVSKFIDYAPKFKCIHLATHATYRSDNPMFSGIRFADGWLLARDLYDMHLDCNLATLSACRTGVAKIEDGDELFGLIRGFLVAGVKSLIVSLWPVDDRATSLMMRRFYGELSRGSSHSEALGIAQRAVRRSFPNPYFWAAFALYGKAGVVS